MMIDDEVEEIHIPHIRDEDDQDGDSDRELQVAFASGLLKPGLFRPITAPPPAINNEVGLLEKLEEISQSDLEWVERLDVTIKRNKSEVTEDDQTDVHNDFQREVSFYGQAQNSVISAMLRLHSSGINTKRPDDYFAEMAKKDDHMKKVGVKLLALKKRRETSEKNQNNFKLRKYGKQVQRAVTLERQQKKREVLSSIKKFKKGKITNTDFLDDSSKENRPQGKKLSQLQKLQKHKVNHKRNFRDKKYGFGGKKKGQKRNTNTSSNDVSGFKRKVHGNKKNVRPGKSKRTKLKSKR
uniref:Uncharacterized protein n=1 Tax=Ciona savignyi TaxID=51511 RepID=H2YQ43_CIOSA